MFSIMNILFFCIITNVFHIMDVITRIEVRLFLLV